MAVQDIAHIDERIEHTPSVVGRLSAHAARLAQLIHVCDPGQVASPAAHVAESASRLHQEIRLELRRDYDAADHRALSRAEMVAQCAVYRAHVELSAGYMCRSPRMLTEARKAFRVLEAAVRTLHAPTAQATRMERPASV